MRDAHTLPLTHVYAQLVILLGFWVQQEPLARECSTSRPHTHQLLERSLGSKGMGPSQPLVKAVTLPNRVNKKRPVKYSQSNAHKGTPI